MLETTLTGLAQVPPAQLELFRMLGASRWQTLLRLQLPSGLPAVLSRLARSLERRLLRTYSPG